MPFLSIIEESYREKLVQKVIRGLDSSQGSFICICGDDSKFAKCLAENMQNEDLIYASDVDANLENAENEGGVTTLQCEFDDAKNLRTLGKYDGVVVKDVLEHHILDHGDFLESIWRLLKLNGTAVLLLRPSPPFPTPSNLREIWTNAVPDLETLLDLAKNEDYMFEPDITDMKEEVTISKSDLSDLLYSFPGAVELDITVFLENLDKDEVTFEDDVTLLCLKKVID